MCIRLGQVVADYCIRNGATLALGIAIVRPADQVGDSVLLLLCGGHRLFSSIVFVLQFLLRYLPDLMRPRPGAEACLLRSLLETVDRAHPFDVRRSRLVMLKFLGGTALPLIIRRELGLDSLRSAAEQWVLGEAVCLVARTRLLDVVVRRRRL